MKHNNLMLRSERRERLEAWAPSDSPLTSSVLMDGIHCGSRLGRGRRRGIRVRRRLQALPLLLFHVFVVLRRAAPGRGIRRQAAGPLRDEVAGPGRERLVDGPAAAQDKTGQREREERGDMACIGRTVDP